MNTGELKLILKDSQSTLFNARICFSFLEENGKNGSERIASEAAI